MLEKLEQEKENINKLNAEIADGFLKNIITYADTEWLEASIDQTIFALQNMKDTIESGKRLNKLSPKKAKQEITPEYIVKRIEKGFETATETTPEFKDFCKIFEKMMENELKKIHATNYKQINNHFFISGFFTVGEQFYYFQLDDIRWGTDKMLIRTAESYNDYKGGINRFIKVKTDMFKELV